MVDHLHPLLTRDDARRQGLSRHDVDRLVRRGHWVPEQRGLYAPAGTVLSVADRAAAALAVGPRGAVVGEGLALVLHGADPGIVPAELVLVAPPGTSGQRRGVLVRQRALRSDERGVAQGLPTTTPAYAALDCARRLPDVRAVVLLDHVLQRCGTSQAELVAAVERRAGGRGVVRLRRLVEAADPGAQSPQETRMRLLITGAGLPRPVSQLEVRDGGWLLAVGDLGYEAARTLLEYDGHEAHSERSRFRRDRVRDRRLQALGWTVLRFTDADLHAGAGGVADEVRRVLARSAATATAR